MSIQIVSGRFARRKLAVPKGGHVRPSTSQLRGALCNILHNFSPQYLPGARVLDLFAGSGAIGFEMLSWGAVQVDFVEQHPTSINTLRENQKALHVEKQTTLYTEDVFRFLHRTATKAKMSPYSVIFADPPYVVANESNATPTPIARLLAFLDGHLTLLEPEGIIIFEQSQRDTALLQAINLSCIDRRVYGDSVLTFWTKN